MNKGQMKRDAGTHAVLRRIEARWKCVELARAWTGIPKQDRDRVLADFEQGHRDPHTRADRTRKTRCGSCGTGTRRRSVRFSSTSTTEGAE